MPQNTVQIVSKNTLQNELFISSRYNGFRGA